MRRDPKLISQNLAPVDIVITLKPPLSYSYCFPSQKVMLISNKNLFGTVYLITCQNCNAVYVGETGRSVKNRKREHVNAIKIFNATHAMNFDHWIDCYIS